MAIVYRRRWPGQRLACSVSEATERPRKSEVARTTLAYLFTLLLLADLSSAVRASLRSWSNDEFDDGLVYGWHARLRRWTVDSFFRLACARRRCWRNA